MMRLIKNGIVREVETELEAVRLTGQGYEAAQTAPKQEGAEKLAGLTMAQLTELCKEKGVEIPAEIKKKADLITLILNSEEE